MFIKNLIKSFIMVLAIVSHLKGTSAVPMSDVSDNGIIIQERSDATAGIFSMKPLGKPKVATQPSLFPEPAAWGYVRVIISDNPFFIPISLQRVPLHKRRGLDARCWVLIVGTYDDILKEFGLDFATYISAKTGELRAELEGAMLQADSHGQFLKGQDADTCALEFSKMVFAKLTQIKKSLNRDFFNDGLLQCMSIIAYAECAMEHFGASGKIGPIHSFAKDFYTQAFDLHHAYPPTLAVLKKAKGYVDLVNDALAWRRIPALPAPAKTSPTSADDVKNEEKE